MLNIFIHNTGSAVSRPATTLLTGFVLLTMAFSSCDKKDLPLNSQYALRVFNGVDGGVHVYGNYNGERPAKFRTAQYLQNRVFTASSLFFEDNIRATYFSIPDTLAKDKPILAQDFNLSSSRINTLFLMGDKSAVDYLFAPLSYKNYKVGDSVSYLTFVNISNDQPVSVNIKGNSNGSLVGQLEYKKWSEIIELPVPVTINSYSVEFRDAATGDSLTTFKIDNSEPILGGKNTWLYKNSSIVLVGKRGQTGIDKLGVVRIIHD